MNVFDKVVSLLQTHHTTFRVLEHPPEGRTEYISKIRGNELCQAMKAMVVMAKMTKKERKYYLAILPGNCSLDLNAVKEFSNATEGVMLAPLDRAKALTECEMGAIPPFSFHNDLLLIVDPLVKNNKEVVFNAGTLERSIFMNINDYIRIVQPTFISISKLKDS
jgi:Ala-tRNA(Pro) deacylase